MKYLVTFLLMSCSIHKTSLHGTVDIIEREWCSVELADQSSTAILIKLSDRDRDEIKEGDQIIFYYKVEK